MKTENFEIRPYGRTELAIMYSPDITPEAAWRKLCGWIDHHPRLPLRLRQMGYDPRRQRIFTPAQVAAIAEEIGEP